MKIWIDLANAPHVVFFQPIIRKLIAAGHEVKITMRDFNNTVEIAREHDITGHVVGRHGGRSDLSKLVNLAIRSLQLAKLAIRWKPDVVVSHNSYTHTISGRLIGGRVITIMDYEGQPANHIAFRLAHQVVVPDCFPESALRRFGARKGKVQRYSGFKEQLYLSEYQPDAQFVEKFREACGLPKSWDISHNVVVTVRTPATIAAYHHFKNELFGKLLALLEKRDDLTVVVLPRNREQKDYIRRKFPSFKVPNRPLIGADLVYYSDVVISAGGTMNREAAIVGTPAYTIFAGELPAVDRKLIVLGRLTGINSLYDLSMIRFEKRKNKDVLRNPGLCDEINAQLLRSPGHHVILTAAGGGVGSSKYRGSGYIRLFKFYYIFKTFIPRQMQVDVRRFVARHKRTICRRHWPIDKEAANIPEGFSAWPDGRRFALVLRHDVESPAGLRRVVDLARLESRLGYRSAYYLVPQAYAVSPELLGTLREGGNEIGVHGWNHDGNLYLSRSIFEKRSVRINRILQQWQAVGFASPSAHHHFEWLHDLHIQYDTSSFDTDPFEPQPDGVSSIYPLVIRQEAGSYVELPYTLPQDFSLYVILREKNNNIWKDKLDWIVEKGGMVLLNTHPDYMHFEPGTRGRYEYPVWLYEDFLKYVRSKYDGLFWHALPCEVAAFWRNCFAGVGMETVRRLA